MPERGLKPGLLRTLASQLITVLNHDYLHLSCIYKSFSYWLLFLKSSPLFSSSGLINMFLFYIPCNLLRKLQLLLYFNSIKFLICNKSLSGFIGFLKQNGVVSISCISGLPYPSSSGWSVSSSLQIHSSLYQFSENHNPIGGTFMIHSAQCL